MRPAGQKKADQTAECGRSAKCRNTKQNVKSEVPAVPEGSTGGRSVSDSVMTEHEPEQVSISISMRVP